MFSGKFFHDSIELHQHEDVLKANEEMVQEAKENGMKLFDTAEFPRLEFYHVTFIRTRLSSSSGVRLPSLRFFFKFHACTGASPQLVSKSENILFAGMVAN